MTTPTLSPTARRVRGFTLIELLISMTIGLVLIGALGVVMNRFEVSKRRNASSSDLALNTGYLAYDLDRQLRSAGSGVYQITQSFGCIVSVATNGAQLLPATSAFPAPFSGVNQTVRALPLLVYPGIGANGSDVIQVITGSAGVSEAPLRVSPGSVQAASLQLSNTLGIRGGDLLLLSEAQLPGCLIVQAAPNFVGGANQLLNLSGPFQAGAAGPATLVAFGVGKGNTYLSNLGNQSGNNPRFQLLGVNASNQLVGYDMLRLNNLPGAPTTPVPLADGVVDLRVRYGVDTKALPNGTITGWAEPGVGNFTPGFMSADSDPARAQVRQIMAVRVAIVLRSDRIESDPVSPATLTMFQSLPNGMQYTFNVPAGDERNRAYRLVEFTVPLRNAIANAPDRQPIP